MKVKWIIGILMACISCIANAEQAYRIAYNETSAPLIPIIKAIYAEIGMSPEFTMVPSERGVVSTNLGDFDADVSRVKMNLDDYPNLIFTSEPIKNTDLLAYVKKGSALKLTQVADLKQNTVGFIHGSKFAEEFIRSEGLESIPANSVESFYKMLAVGRFDVAIVTSTQLMSQAKQLSEMSERVGPVLATSPSYHILNKKHADLLPKLDAALKSMRLDGRLAKLLVENGG